MDKVRVYELARELGKTSPETIQLLKSKLKIRVKSASSTIEEDTATKLKRLLRLEGKTVKKGAAAPGDGDGAADVAAARKRRVERARQKLLREMEEEEQAQARAKEEKERKEQEERERREAEEAARIQAEAERLRQEAEEAAAKAALEAERAAAAALAVESAAEEPGEEEIPEAVAAQAPKEEAPPQPEPVAAAEGEAEPETREPVAASAQEQRAVEPSPPAPAPVSPAAPKGTVAPPRPPARPGPPAATAPAAKSPKPKPFVPGPTSQYVRTRPAPPRVREPARPAPQPPRPAAPIKTVRPRGPEKGKPKRKTKRARPAAEVIEAALPELGARGPRAPRLDEAPQVPKVFRKVALTEGVTVKELAEKLEVKHKDVIKALMGKGVLATINQTLDAEMAQEVAKLFGAEAEILTFEEDVSREEEIEEKPEDLETRAPVVTVMGHVDHGKTSLLDAIRQTKVVEQEAGGITQHVGAYSVAVNQRKVVFLDTPGHEAFTMMRARGAGVTDLVILVVAADDGVMPQTKEAIDHARAAAVPLMVAINKIDKPNANPDRVKQQLAELELVPEDWGGSTVFCEVSAKKREGLDLLLEMVLLVSDLAELKANPSRAGSGTVLEAKLDKGKGPVAHVLVQNGSVSVGDSFVAGAVFGRVRAMLDDRGQKVKQVGPSAPVEILGLTSLPQAGDQFQVFPDSFKARQVSEFRQQKLRERELAGSARLTLDQLHQKVQEGSVKELPIVLKADVQGSVEVLRDTLTKLSTDSVKVRIIHAGAGAITDTDVLLASASNAVVIGFNVRPERTAQDLAEKENIDIRLHTVIYNITDELKKAMEGLLEPTFKEVTLGRAEVRETFKVPKVGVIAGSYVVEGRVVRNAEVRLLRDNIVIYEGKLSSLKRFKEDASEVKDGFECGIGLEGYNDIKVGDVIEVYTMERVQTAAVT
jgi:translation initiation factor IF-2